MSNSLSRDQKRRAKLAKREKKEARSEWLTPYSGQKYQTPEWDKHVLLTEIAIYETIKIYKHSLTNGHVKAALVSLIVLIREGNPAILPENARGVIPVPGSEVDFLIWNIRLHWQILVERVGPVRTEDFVGILRTLLHSLQAHARNTGEHRGYVHFIEGFLGGRTIISRASGNASIIPNPTALADPC
jgi:hypothetical protein